MFILDLCIAISTEIYTNHKYFDLALFALLPRAYLETFFLI
jgi:hypothetical protein